MGKMIQEEKDKLIYDLIFSDMTEFSIDVSGYSDDYDFFVDEVRQILTKSRVVILNSTIDVNGNKINWKLKIKK